MPSLAKTAPATSSLPGKLAQAMAPSVDAGARKVAKKDAKGEAAANGKAKAGKEDGVKRKRDAGAAVAESPASATKKAGKDKPAKGDKAAVALSNGSAGEKAKKVKRAKKDGEAASAEETPKKKKAKKGPVDGEGSERGSEESAKSADEEDPLALTNFSISGLIKDALLRKGIKALFPIQAQTFNIVLANQDLVARARTGQGKTLAFVLPILECLLKTGALSAAGKAYGRPPRVIVLAPTRELAKQVRGAFWGMNRA